MTREKTRIIRTYLSYPEKVDPAHILTMAELELSIALASTLVTFNDSRETVSGLAEKWKADGTSLKFTLRKNLKWSDGSRITAGHFKTSLDRAKRLYASDLQALFGSIHSIEAADDQNLVMKVTSPELVEGVILKLTEPMYGLVAVKSDGSLDLTKSAGPFQFVSSDNSAMKLKANREWFSHRADMADEIELRLPPQSANQVEGFANDDWANLVVGYSIQRNATRESFNNRAYSIWERVSDKLFALYPTAKFLADGGASIMQQLDAQIDPTTLLKGMSGFSSAEQFFPRGYTLWQPERKKKTAADPSVKGKSIRVIVPETYKPMNMSERLPEAITKITKSKVTIEYVALKDVDARMKRQDYDVLATGIAVADPNFEGAISFFIEREPPFIPSSTAPNDFAKQVKTARSLKTNELRAKDMRRIMSDAQNAGHVVPLFHFSSFSVAKNGVDISVIPSNDETIVFSKVRMK